jgi:O-antigen/teichoic acid export membrane protein
MKLYKAFGIYTLSTFFKSAIPFLLLPIITKYLTPEDYGIANFYQVILRLLAGIIMLGVPASCTIFYFKHDRKEYPSLLLNSVVSPFIFTFILFIASFFLVDILTPIFDIDSIWIVLLAPIALLYLVPDITYTTLRNQEKPIKYSIFNLSQIVLHFTITTILIVVFKFNWLGILLGILISLLTLNFLSINHLVRNKLIRGRLNIKRIKYALMLGSPLVLQRIGGLLINKSDALFISIMLGKDVLGIYAVGYQIGMVVLLFQDAFGKAWRPYVFKKLNRNKLTDKIEIVKLSYLLMGLYLLFPIVIYFLSPLIFRIFINERYHDSIIIAPLIALAYSFLGMYKLVTLYIFYMKRTGLLSSFTVINGGINMILNYVFISIFGVLGAAYATILSMFIIFIVAFIISNRVYPMPWNPLRLLRTK